MHILNIFSLSFIIDVIDAIDVRAGPVINEFSAIVLIQKVKKKTFLCFKFHAMGPRLFSAVQYFPLRWVARQPATTSLSPAKAQPPKTKREK